MFKLKAFCLLVIVTLSTSVQARVALNVTLVYHKGVNESLVLTNEVHARKESFLNEFVEVSLNNGIKVRFKVIQISADELAGQEKLATAASLGPSEHIKIKGILFGPKEKKWKEFDQDLRLSVENLITYEDQEVGDTLVVKIIPEYI